jgi:hypothetical protein
VSHKKLCSLNFEFSPILYDQSLIFQTPADRCNLYPQVSCKYIVIWFWPHSQLCLKYKNITTILKKKLRPTSTNHVYFDDLDSIFLVWTAFFYIFPMHCQFDVKGYPWKIKFWSPGLLGVNWFIPSDKACLKVIQFSSTDLFSWLDEKNNDHEFSMWSLRRFNYSWWFQIYFEYSSKIDCSNILLKLYITFLNDMQKNLTGTIKLHL